MELNKIYNMDCLDGMEQIKDESIELIITDPPFNSEKKMGRSFRDTSKNKLSKDEWFIYDKMSTRGYSQWMDFVFKEAYRVLKDGSHIYVFSNWKSLRNLMDIIEANLFTLKNVLIWDKTYFGIGFDYRPQTEFIIFASKGKARPLNRKNISNIIEHKRVTNKEMNSLVQKPVGLIEKLLEFCSIENDCVLDMFMGFGTTAIACLNRGVNYMGFEKNPRYYEIAQKRIDNAKRQLKLEAFDNSKL